MTSRAEDSECLVTYLLIDRQVYEARRWAREWLAIAGLFLLLTAAWIVWGGRGVGLAEGVSMAVVALAGGTLARRDYVAAHKLIQLKCELLAHRFEYLRDLHKRFNGNFMSHRGWSRYIWPAVYAALKLRLVLVILLSLVVDAVSGSEPLNRASFGPTFVTCLMALAFLVLADWIIERRRMAFDRQMLSYAQDLGISLDLKEKAAIALERERNGRF